jgi:hypothetical protein
MKTITMGGKANPEDHALIEEIAGALMPDDQRLGAWLKDYAAGQAPRRAQELEGWSVEVMTGIVTFATALSLVLVEPPVERRFQTLATPQPDLDEPEQATN